MNGPTLDWNISLGAVLICFTLVGTIGTAVLFIVRATWTVERRFNALDTQIQLVEKNGEHIEHRVMQLEKTVGERLDKQENRLQQWVDALAQAELAGAFVRVRAGRTPST